MSYYDRVQKAIDYIEANLAEDILLAEVSKQAYFSLYHFHRVFAGMTGYSLKAYIRKRRLAEAASELVASKSRVIDIALKYGYETPESFSRAFKNELGCSPMHYRSGRGGSGEYFGPLIIGEHTIKGDLPMKPVIKTIASFKVVGFKLETSTADGRNRQEIPQFWQKMLADDCAHLMRIKNVVNPHISYGVCTDVKEDSSFSYIIGFEVSTFDQAEADMCCETIPEARYAVFTAKGTFPECIQQTTQYAYGQWLPKSKYELADKADFEVYDGSRMTDPQAMECDICIPVV